MVANQLYILGAEKNIVPEIVDANGQIVQLNRRPIAAQMHLASKLNGRGAMKK